MNAIRVMFLASIAIFGVTSTAFAKHKHLPKTQKPQVVALKPDMNMYDIMIIQNSKHRGQSFLPAQDQSSVILTQQNPNKNVLSDIAAPVNNTIKTASNYIGTGAARGREKLMKLFSDAFDKKVDPTRISWCAAFANGVLGANKMPVTNSLMAESFSTWGKVTRDPKPGDIVLLRLNGKRISHVSFYVATIDSIKGRCVEALGGNQGHQVKQSCYPVSKVAEYRTLG